MEDLLFKVEKVETKSILGVDYKPASGISHAIVGKGKILHFCSKDYGLVPNRGIYDSFVNYFEKHKMKFEASGTAFRDSRFQMDFAMLDHPTKMDNKGDILFPSIRVLNSYNGYLRYKFAIRILRLVCSNGMTALVDEQVIDMLHTPQVEDGVAVEKSMELLHDFMGIYSDAVEPFIVLQDFPVKDIPNRIEEVIDATDFPIGLKDLAVERALKEIKDYQLESTDWLVYNALNYQLNHNADNLLGRKAARLDKQVLQYLLDY